MAVVDFHEVWSGRRGSLEGPRAVREYTRVFRARTNNSFDGPATLLSQLALPFVLDAYADANGEVIDAGATVRRVEPVQDEEDPYQWTVTVTYSSAPYDARDMPAGAAEGAEGEGLKSPEGLEDLGEVSDALGRPPVVSWGFERFRRPAYLDVLGKPVANSAGVPFVPAPEIDDNRPTITISRNEAALDPAVILAYQDAVNSDAWAGFAPGTCKLSIAAESQFDNGLFYWRATYTVHLRRETWRLVLQDRGFGERLAQDNSLATIVDPTTGQPATEPSLLDGTGHKLGASAAPVLLTFVVYKELPYAALNLPTRVG